MDTNFKQHKNYADLLRFAQSTGATHLAELVTYPRFFQIETVALCNARCIMCPIKEVERENKIMEQALFEKIVKDLAQQVQLVRKITIQLDGEPLLDKDLEKRSLLLKENGFKKIAISSNGSLMDEKRAESILKSGISEVSFSVDGTTSGTVNAIRRGLDFDTCKRNVLNFIELRNAMDAKVDIRVRMVIQKDNAHEHKAFLEYWRKKVRHSDRVYAKYEHNWMNWSANCPHKEADAKELNRKACISPWGSMVILTDGRVALCCSDYNARYVLGDLKHDSIRKVWQGPIARKMRMGHLARGRSFLKTCLNCNVWDDDAKLE